MIALPPSERLIRERRRLIAVREIFRAALKAGARGDGGHVPFYLAIVDYLDAAMHRLQIQDVRMGEMIRTQLGTALDAKAVQALAEIDARLTSNQKELRDLREAAGLLRREGLLQLDPFEQAARRYASYMAAAFGVQVAVRDIANSVFSADDWAYMAAITTEESEREQALHARIVQTMPPDVVVPTDLPLV